MVHEWIALILAARDLGIELDEETAWGIVYERCYAAPPNSVPLPTIYA